MKTILIIGIGAGDPDYITVQAVKALNTRRRLLHDGEGPGQAEAARAARASSAGATSRIAPTASPRRRARRATRAPADYRACVDELNRAKQDVFERMIAGELDDGADRPAVLVWGDPDRSTTAPSATSRRSRPAAAINLDYEVIPGISAVQALAARHKIPLNRIAEPVQLTTGRKLAEGLPPGIDSVVVLLDGEDTYRRFADQDIDIYWGAYLGTPDEILISGKLPTWPTRSIAAAPRRAAPTAGSWILI